jgi:hypothetical protein
MSSSKNFLKRQQKLIYCTMMKNFMASGALSKGKNSYGDPGEKGVTPVPGEEVFMLIYGGPPHPIGGAALLT